MKAPYESGIKKDFPENATEWIASGGKRCTDGGAGAHEGYPTRPQKISDQGPRI